MRVKIQKTTESEHHQNKVPLSFMCTLKPTYSDCIHPFLPKVFPDAVASPQQDDTPCDSAKIVQELFGEHDKEFKVLTWSPKEKNSLIHGSPTLYLTEQGARKLHRSPATSTSTEKKEHPA